MEDDEYIVSRGTARAVGAPAGCWLQLDAISVNSSIQVYDRGCNDTFFFIAELAAAIYPSKMSV